MANKELLETIRKEIINRIDKRHLSAQAQNELVSVLSFLDTLQEQPVDLDDAINNWQGIEAFPEGCGITPLPKAMEIVDKTARHFYELGRNTKEQIVCEDDEKYFSILEGFLNTCWSEYFLLHEREDFQNWIENRLKPACKEQPVCEEDRIKRELIAHLEQEVNSATLDVNRKKWKEMLDYVKGLNIQSVCEDVSKEKSLSLQIQAYLNTASDELYAKGKPLYSEEHHKGIHECMQMWQKLHNAYFHNLIKEQPVCEELGREMDRFFTSEEYEEAEKAGFGETHAARHFAQWGAEHADDTNPTDSFYEAFKEGALWMREQMMKELSEKIASAYQLGLADKEKQMMKED